MKTLFSFFTVIFIVFFTNNIYSKEYVKTKNRSHISLKRLVDSLSLKPSAFEIKISKSKQELSIQYKSLTIKSYLIVLGENPIDDKMQQGDGCTPEGIFKVKTKYPHKDWSKFIWIDYPNKDSWTKFNQAKKEGRIGTNAKIGGDIGIHGVPKGREDIISQKQNWTLGCISLSTNDINEIYPFIFNGMLIKIEK